MVDPHAAFTAAQTRWLAGHGTQARSRLLTPATPVRRVHVLEAGTGEPLLLLHGGNSVAAALDPLLGALAHDFHVYAPDRPGCGLTEMLSYRGVDLRQHAIAFVRATLDALGLARASLVGNSMGGYFALVFALAHPDRVSKLVLVGEPAGSARRPPLPQQLLGRRGLNRLLYATVLKPSRRTIEAGHRRLLVAHPDRLPETYWDLALAAAQLPGAQQSWLTLVERCLTRSGRSRLTYALRPELPGLAVPTLFVWGEQDRLGPPQLGVEMAALLPEARTVTVPDAGHLVWLDQPEVVARTVQAFLAPEGARASTRPSGVIGSG